MWRLTNLLTVAYLEKSHQSWSAVQLFFCCLICYLHNMSGGVKNDNCLGRKLEMTVALHHVPPLHRGRPRAPEKSVVDLMQKFNYIKNASF